MAKELLKIEHITKSFDETVILRDLSLTVKEGEVLVIVGPSGCGKSTFLRCINGLETIQEGSIYLDGEKINDRSANLEKVRQKIGMVFQNYELFPHKTVLQNITMAPMLVQKKPKAEAEKEALSLLERVGLSDRKNFYPRQLSGGQKQRVAIVRALAMHP
ncbi:MAG: ATP-binding cassette domain-containing protein, partial [Lachnospiraceae bacterium]|nr:ATP-binding cassette domain-containing protein [Lachnospiraceae bacterium]